MKAKPLWFGKLLVWQYNRADGTRRAIHDGFTHEIIKLSRRQADEARTQPGWHMFGVRWEGIGPSLGATVPHAQRLAEGWIICGYHDVMTFPKLHLVIGGANVIWNHQITLRAQPHLGRVALARTGGREFAYIYAEFTGRDKGNALHSEVAVRWQAKSYDGKDLTTACDTWTQVITRLDQQITQLGLFDGAAARSGGFR